MNPHDNSGRFAATDAIASKLGDLRDEMRNSIREVDDPQGRANCAVRPGVQPWWREMWPTWACRSMTLAAFALLGTVTSWSPTSDEVVTL